MKKKILIISALLCLLTVLLAFPASATEGTLGDNITWSFDNGTLTISGSGAMETANHYPWSGYRGSTTTIIVESGITSISYGAFINFQSLTSVSLPTTVTSIGENAFNGCRSLSALPLSTAITSLGSYAFSGCSSVQSATIPSSLSEIPYAAFFGCSNLSSVTIPNGVTAIGTNAFGSCYNLTSVTIPDSVTHIDSGAFSDCRKLASVQLSSNLKAVSNNAFSSCSSLTQITIPDSVTTIGNYAFNGCASLQSVYLGAGVSSIGETAFWKCPKLAAFTISPNNPNFTTDKGFIYNKSKTQLIRGPQGYQGSYSIPPGTTKIAARACYECSGITSLVFPDSVTAIEEDAFAHCVDLKSVTLSNSLNSIETDGFGSCSSLTEITIPASLTKIGSLAFSRCSSLTKITFLGMAPMIEEEATVYYPANKPGWKDSQHLYGGMLTWMPMELDCKGSHTSATKPAIAPTCTEPGSKGGTECTKCGTVLTKPTVVPATGHQYSSWTLEKRPTEDKPGVAQRRCSVCQIWDSKDIHSMEEYEALTGEAPKNETPETETPEAETPETESAPTEDSQTPATVPNTVPGTNSQKQKSETSKIRAWVIGISAIIVLGAAIAASTVAVIQKKK